VIESLREHGVAVSDLQAFYVTMPGQHAQHAIGGDRYADPLAQEAPKGQAAGAGIGAVAGLVAGGLAATAVPPLALAIVAGVTGVGALAGSIAGAVTSSKSKEEAGYADQPAVRRGGMMVAVRVTPQNESEVVELLRAGGATDIERARGEWRDGHWVDFDPTEPPRKVEAP
jgi:hypothetical protein